MTTKVPLVLIFIMDIFMDFRVIAQIAMLCHLKFYVFPKFSIDFPYLWCCATPYQPQINEYKIADKIP